MHTATDLPDHRTSASVLRDWLDRHQRIFILTGAGVSTASGIPDYRDTDGAWKRPPPVTYQALVGDQSTYRRYWARSFVGWPIFSRADPNRTHRALAMWQNAERVTALVTQNVDGLHQRAGSERVIDLHGRLDHVICLSCGAAQTRMDLQAAMLRTNPDWRFGDAISAPDGDADIDAAATAHFVPPHCAICDGMLKPDVVFYGENVPRARYAHALEALHAADAVLVVGSSLMVYSGFRFARMAHERDMPIAIVNRGITGADALASIKIDADCGEILGAAMQS